jgi:eukaryotic-like serine/threonine-protein kinase
VAVDTDILPPRYRGAQQIGRGGMGDIYRVTDATLGRAVAIKILAERFSEDDSVRGRFTREALSAARLSGEPNIVTIFDVGEYHERPYIVMEYLGGGSLDDVLRKEGRQPPERAFVWLEQAARALDAAHREGVVHRDVKPANLLLDRSRNVHVADFGIASAAGMDSLTVTGTVLGTAGYLSPEQAQGERATPESDEYGLAVVAFELLTGNRPFEADSPTAEAAAHVHAAIPSVCERSGSLPCELDPVFDQALAKDPRQRYATCGEFVAALRAAMADAAGSTSELPVVAPAPTAVTERIAREDEADAWHAPRRSPLVPVTRPARPRRSYAPLLALLVAGAIAGALAAYFLTRGDGGTPRAAPQPSISIRRVTVQGQPTTVVSTVLPPPSTSASPPPASPGSGSSGHALNDAGYAKMRKGDYGGAVPLLQQAVSKLSGVGPGDPYEAYANYNLGYSLLQLGRCGEAIPYLQRAKRLEPQRSEPARDLARARACA